MLKLYFPISNSRGDEDCCCFEGIKAYAREHQLWIYLQPIKLYFPLDICYFKISSCNETCFFKKNKGTIRSYFESAWVKNNCSNLVISGR